MEIGKPLVEVIPGRGAAAMQLRSAARFSFVPDFFGNDVLFDARETAATRVFAPAENFLVGLDEGHASLTMLTWPQGGGDKVLLLPEGSGPQRRFVATQVSFGGKSLFAAVLAADGIWFEQDLRTVEKDKTVAVDGWQRPFPAKWLTILVQRPRAGATQGISSESLLIPTLPVMGDTPYSDVYYHPWVPSWFTGTQWRLHLETSRQMMMTHEIVQQPEHLLAINYPRDRVRETPLDALTLVDIMRQSLGTGPCEYILDLEGLNRTRSTGAAGTGKPTTAATCSERGGLMYYYLGERTETPRRDEKLVMTDDALVSVEKIKDFLDAAHARIQEYLAWSDDIVRLANEAKALDPHAAELADRIIPIAQETRELWAAMVREDKPCTHPQEWRMALTHCQDLIREGAPNLGQRVADFDPQMRGAGEEVDGGMQACRMLVKRIRQEAAMIGSENPAALKLAVAVRQRCRDILRNKHYKEGDDVKLAKVDPSAALALAEKTTNYEEYRIYALRGVLRAWASQDPAAARAALEGRPEPVATTTSLALKSHILYEVAVESAARDPAVAADLVEKWAGVVDYYTYRAGAAAVIAEAWARKDPERVVAWAEKLTPEHHRAAALRAAARGWTTRSAARSLAWAEAIHNPQDAVQALVGVAEAELPPSAQSKP